MKNTVLFIVVAVLFVRCNSGISGKGNIISEKREVAPFHALESNVIAEITIVQDSAQSIEVKGYENLLPLLRTEVENGMLTLKMKKDVHMTGKNDLEVTVHVPSLDKIRLSGVGSINSQGNFNFRNVEIQLSGVGSINISGQSSKTILTNSGASSIECKNLLSDTTIATTSGVGSIECNALRYLKATVSGVGSISYTGDPVVEKSVSGVGSVTKE
jgi:hypothetical protein